MEVVVFVAVVVVEVLEFVAEGQATCFALVWAFAKVGS